MYQGIWNVSLLESLEYILNGWSLRINQKGFSNNTKTTTTDPMPTQINEKLNFLRNISFSENFAYVLNDSIRILENNEI